MDIIIITIVLFLCGMGIGLSIGVQLVTKHLVANNRLTPVEASWYYSISNLIKIYKEQW
jgi:hypothetical protein